MSEPGEASTCQPSRWIHQLTDHCQSTGCIGIHFRPLRQGINEAALYAIRLVTSYLVILFTEYMQVSSTTCSTSTIGKQLFVHLDITTWKSL